MTVRNFLCCLALLAPTLPVVAATQANDSALVELERCRATLDPIVDVGYARIVARCPKLPDLMANAEWHGLLPPGWQNRSESLSVGSLAALESLLRDAKNAAPTRVVLDVTRLAAALAPLDTSVDRSVSGWERLKRWLQRLFKADDSDQTSLLERLSGTPKLSESLSRILTYAGYLTLIGFAVFVVTSELRAAGVLARRRAGGESSRTTGPFVRRARSLADVDKLSLTERPAALLLLVVERLSRLRDNAPLAALTTRELVAATRKMGDKVVSQLETVGEIAEQVRYAADQPTTDALSTADATGRELLATLGRQRPVTF